VPVVDSFHSFANIGKFTLDWIKSNSNASSFLSGTIGHQAADQFLLYQNQYDLNEELEEYEQLNADDEDNYNDDDSDDMDMEIKVAEKQTMNRRKFQQYSSQLSHLRSQAPVLPSIINNTSVNAGNHSTSSSMFYEAKCAFSRYWTDFSFERNDKMIAQDVKQFWNLYYSYVVCKPLLGLVNCRLFYIKFNFLKRMFNVLKRLKNRVMPLREFDTGHGFKLFSS
jgi:hypothetical protein